MTCILNNSTNCKGHNMYKNCGQSPKGSYEQMKELYTNYFGSDYAAARDLTHADVDKIKSRMGGDLGQLDRTQFRSNPVNMNEMILKQTIGGLKDDTNKPNFDRLSFQALGEFNKVHEAGDSKYAEGNWRQGLAITRLLNAAIRHITKMLDGELIDSETKTLHSANAGVNMEMVTHYLLNREKYKEFLDLPKRPEPNKKIDN